MTVTNETLINIPPRDLARPTKIAGYPDLTIIVLDKLEKRAVLTCHHSVNVTPSIIVFQDLTYRVLAAGWDKDELKSFCSEMVDDSQKALIEIIRQEKETTN